LDAGRHRPFKPACGTKPTSVKAISRAGRLPSPGIANLHDDFGIARFFWKNKGLAETNSDLFSHGFPHLLRAVLMLEVHT
jgi:hypothetical protein